MTRRDDLLVSPAALAGELAAEPGPVLRDVRWRLGGPPGIDGYREGHLPGAVFVDLDRDLSGPPGPAGRHPPPDPAGFLAAAGGGNGGALWFWRPTAAQAFHTLSLPNNARDLHFHPDGRRLAVAFFDGAVRIYDMTRPA